MIIIDGKEYIEKSTEGLPFGNVCRHCAFYGTLCYDREDFDCHSDSRKDKKDVFFVLANNPMQPTRKVGRLIYDAGSRCVCSDDEWDPVPEHNICIACGKSRK